MRGFGAIVALVGLVAGTPVGSTAAAAAGAPELTFSPDVVIRPGEPVDFFISIRNPGPQAMSAVSLDDVFPADMVAPTWACAGSGGGTCTPTGTGDIHDHASVLPVGAAVVFSVHATIRADNVYSVTNHVDVEWSVDGNPAGSTSGYVYLGRPTPNVGFTSGTLTFSDPRDSLECRPYRGQNLVADPDLGSSDSAFIEPHVSCIDVAHVVSTGGDGNEYLYPVTPSSRFPSLVDTTARLGGGSDVYMLSDVHDDLDLGSGPDVLLGRPPAAAGVDVSTDIATLGSGDDLGRLEVGGGSQARTELDFGGDAGDTLRLTSTGDSARPVNDLRATAVPGGYRFSSPGQWWEVEAIGVARIELRRTDTGGEIVEPSTTTHLDIDVGASVVAVDTRGLRPVVTVVDPTAEPRRTTVTVPGFQPIDVVLPSHSGDVVFFDGRPTDFLRAVYREFLGRDADPGGIEYWVTQLEHGRTRAEVVAALLRLPEHAGLAVDETYRYLLRRSPEPGGRRFWTDFIGTGGDLDRLRALVYGSDEYFVTRGAGSVDGFVVALYNDVLHRAPDEAGRRYWTGAIARGTPRDRVAAAILGLPEPIEVAVADAYLHLLGRAADGAEQDYWRRVWTQSGEFTVVAALAGSNEFYDRRSPVDPAITPE